MNDFGIVDKKDLDRINKMNEKYNQEKEKELEEANKELEKIEPKYKPNNNGDLFNLFGQEDVKEESIVQKLESNDWTNFSNDKLVHLVGKVAKDYTGVKIPVEHNNAVFRDFLETVKNKERLFHAMQTETLLQAFGRKLLYDHLKRSTILKTLDLCHDSFSIFHTADQSPGIETGFIDNINLARNKKELLVRTIPKELAMNTDLAESLHIESNKLILMDYLFAFNYIFHNDSRYMEGTVVTKFDTYYKPFVTEMVNRTKNKDNVIWLINKFSNMLGNVIAWDDERCDKCKGKFEGFSQDDIPNIKVMKRILHETAILIQENTRDKSEKEKGLNIASLPNGAYLVTILKKYDSLYNSMLFENI